MNLNYAFWVDYYSALYEADALTVEGVDTKNRELTERVWEDGQCEIPLQKQSFCLKVLYPGLLMGLGYSHKSGKKESDAMEIGLGINLDYVTGLPYVPGSTVKGILRGAFIRNEAYVAEHLSQVTGREFSVPEIWELERAVFGKQHPQDERAIALETAARADCFLDAYPVRTGAEGRLLGLENITPHCADDPVYQGLTNPTILTLLKVMPGVVFQFRFLLTDTGLSGGVTVTAEQKLELFQNLLKELGVGARSNVGFGAMEGTEPISNGTYLEGGKKERKEAAAPQNRSAADRTPTDQERRAAGQPQTEEPSAVRQAQSEEELKAGSLFWGTVKTILPYAAFVELLPGVNAFVHCTQVDPDAAEGKIGDFIAEGDRVAVKIMNPLKSGKPQASIKQVPAHLRRST